MNNLTRRVLLSALIGILLISAASFTMVAHAASSTITVGSRPSGMAFDPSNGYLYVANSGSNTVSVINTATNTVVGSPITVGTSPSCVAFDSANGEIYVTNSGSNTVSVINTANNAIIGSPITVGSIPSGIAFDSSNGDIYVTNSGSPPYYAGTVSVISTPSNMVTNTITNVKENPTAVAFASSNGDIYVAVIDEVDAIYPPTNAVSLVAMIGPSTPVGLAVDTSNGFLYIVSQPYSVSNPGSVSVVDTSTNTNIAAITVGFEPKGAAFNPSNGNIYVANENDGTVSVISTLSNKIVGNPLPVGSLPTGVAFVSSNGDIYVTNSWRWHGLCDCSSNRFCFSCLSYS